MSHADASGPSRRRFLTGAAVLGAAVAAQPFLSPSRARAAVTVDVTDLGAVGDGTHDDGPAIRAAVTQVNGAGGGTVHFPAGTYRYVATGVLSLGAGVTLLGDGASSSVISYEASGDTDFAENAGDAVVLKDLTVRRNGDFISRLFLVNSHAGVTFDGVTLDGALDVFQADSYSYGIQLGEDDGTPSGVHLLNGTMITKTAYGLVQLSESTATVTDIQVRNCSFTQNYADDLEFNAPNGLMNQIVVDTCTFSDNRGQDQGAGFGVGVAHGTNVTVSNCSFTDYYHEAVHVEDRSQNVKILNNTFTRCGTIQFADIQVVSATDTVLIQDNTFHSADAKGANYAGVVTCNQGGGPTPTNITVNHNTIDRGDNNGVVFQVDGGAVTNNTFTSTGGGQEYVDWGSTGIDTSGNTPPV